MPFAPSFRNGSGTIPSLLTRTEQYSTLEESVDCSKCIFQTFYRGGFFWLDSPWCPPVAPCPSLIIYWPKGKNIPHKIHRKTTTTIFFEHLQNVLHRAWQPPPYPFVRRVWCSDYWRPPETVKMTSNECCDIVGWRAYLGTSQRNHDHQCSKSLPWTALVYTLPMVLAVNWSLRFFC
jgi:hypothetical protein